MRKALQALILSLLLCVLQVSAYAQTAILTGKVTDKETGEALPSATVFIVGTYLAVYTADDGSFEIKDIKPGDYSIRVTYIGYAEQLINGVSFEAGQTVSRDIQMSPSVSTLGEVEIVGQRGIIDLESGKSEIKITDKDIQEMSVKNVQEIVAMQNGVNETPDGIQIRGGRVYETQYLIDGINAQDPLAGTGFGVDVNANAIQSVEVITGGSDAEYGDGSSGVIVTKIKEGGRDFDINASYYRDNLGFNVNQGMSWNTDEASLSISGPIIRDKLTFFVSGSMFLTDNYYRSQADQLHSSLFTNDSLFAIRQDNRWSNTLKLAYDIKPGLKLTITNQKSLNINQSTRSLQIIGNDEVVRPGFQYNFSLDLDNANTYTHNSNLTILNFRGLITNQWSFSFSAGRLFTNLRADANGRPFREKTVDQLYDPSSIVTDPLAVFNPANDSVLYVLPGPGLINNGGIATLWHDHYAQEYTVKTKFTYHAKNDIHHISFGQEHKEQTYQWIDVTRPWIGAPIQVNDTLTTASTSLGQSSDFWKASPATGGLFVQDEIRFKGLIAVLGVRFNYWAAGRFVDDAVENEAAPVLDAIREDYRRQSVKLGRRFKARILPRLRVSFPVTENNVLYFNYSHAMRMPHPRFVYAGLDPVYQDRSFLSNLGNPNLNPEVTVSYEIGLKSQLTKDLALTVTAFYNDKFDYIVSRRIQVQDQTGRFVQKTFFINQDYARIRGLEVSLTQRIGKWFVGNLAGSYSIATGKSNSAAESALQIQQQGFVNTTKEQFLAWDRPFDFKLLLIFKPDSTFNIGRFPLRNFRFTVASQFKSGLRYTPFQLVDTLASGRPEYEVIQDQPFARVGRPWFWTDVRISRDFFFRKGASLSLSLEFKNIFNNKNALIVNPVTGTGYRDGDPLPATFRDPVYPDPQDGGSPPYNPARWMAPRQMRIGAILKF